MTLPPAPHRATPAPAVRVAPPALADEALKRRRLVAMKRVALALLVGAILLFIIALLLEGRYPWLAYVRAAAEAAVVGGVADWFAVTALFRHPLGIPIPHTAIVPARKDRIGQALGNFVQQNFLSRDVVERKLAGLRIGERAVAWLTDPEHTRGATRALTHALAAGAMVLRDEDVHGFVDRTAGERLRQIQVAPILGRVLELVTDGGRHQELLDEALRLATRLTDQHDALIREKVREQTPWWIPGVLDEKISDRVVSGIGRTLAEVSDDPDHPLRRRFDDSVARFIERLRTSPETIARAEAIKNDLLGHPAVRDFSAAVWADIKGALRHRAERPDDAPPGRLEEGIASVARTVLSDPALAAKVNRWVDEGVLAAVDASRTEVATLIAQTVSAWDPAETSRRIELQIGRDLQFVRVNGTIVGALVGLLLYAITRAVG